MINNYTYNINNKFNLIYFIMSELRKYEINTPQYELYKQMHEKQTLDYVMKKRLQYSK